jgi:hypothetical protein
MHGRLLCASMIQSGGTSVQLDAIQHDVNHHIAAMETLALH